jgi:hypothetical protein
MLRADEVSAQIEQVLHSGMGANKSLSLPYGFEFSHPSLPDPGSFVGLFYPIIGLLLSAMNHVRHQLPICDTIATQFICHDLPGFTAFDRNRRLKKRLAANPSRLAWR